MQRDTVVQGTGRRKEKGNKYIGIRRRGTPDLPLMGGSSQSGMCQHQKLCSLKQVSLPRYVTLKHTSLSFTNIPAFSNFNELQRLCPLEQFCLPRYVTLKHTNLLFTNIPPFLTLLKAPAIHLDGRSSKMVCVSSGLKEFGEGAEFAKPRQSEILSPANVRQN